MTTDNTMTLAYQNVKKAQTQITTKDYKLKMDQLTNVCLKHQDYSGVGRICSGYFLIVSNLFGWQQ